MQEGHIVFLQKEKTIKQSPPRSSRNVVLSIKTLEKMNLFQVCQSVVSPSSQLGGTTNICPNHLEVANQKHLERSHLAKRYLSQRGCKRLYTGVQSFGQNSCIGHKNHPWQHERHPISAGSSYLGPYSTGADMKKTPNLSRAKHSHCDSKAIVFKSLSLSYKKHLADKRQ